MKNSVIILLFLFISFYAFSQKSELKNILKDPQRLTKALAENNVWGKKIFIGNSNNGTPIYAYYYNKGGTDTAMILAGVHGSEFYGSDVAYRVKEDLDKLKVSKFKWKVLLIPELFVDNLKEGRSQPFNVNYGRKTCKICHGQKEECENHCVDPNRQMPKINDYFKIGETISCIGEKIELENQYLIYITQKFDPSRIISIHCKNAYNENEIGIYADPRTDKDNMALGYSEDVFLVLKMAYLIKENNGIINGNFIDKVYNNDNDFKLTNVYYLNPVYPQDPPATNKGGEQKRSYEQNGGKVSFGTWASTEIKDDKKRLKKAALTITAELPQYYSFFDNINGEQILRTKDKEQNTLAYVKAIRYVFLENR